MTHVVCALLFLPSPWPSRGTAKLNDIIMFTDMRQAEKKGDRTGVPPLVSSLQSARWQSVATPTKKTQQH